MLEIDTLASFLGSSYLHDPELAGEVGVSLKVFQEVNSIGLFHKGTPPPPPPPPPMDDISVSVPGSIDMIGQLHILL